MPGPAASSRTAIARKALTKAEDAAPLEVEVALKMRNFAELEARIARGEIISRQEMEAKYFPLAADYDATAAWLAGQGLTVDSGDSTHLSIFVRGTVQQLTKAFDLQFARVASRGAEFTAAITAPSLPAGLAVSVAGINGLQPYLRPEKMFRAPTVQKASLTQANAPPYLPSEILRAYNANNLGLDGAGQTIAIIIDTFPINSDLTTYWNRCGINQSLDNIQKIQVTGATAAPDPTVNGAGIEAAIDTELTSAVAPAATIRIYAAGRLDFGNLTKAYQQVYNDVEAHPELNLHQLNLSYGISESDTTQAQALSDAQHFAALASAGVTVFASTGDGGSNPIWTSSGYRYSASAPASPSHPASDPNVTGVGSTNLQLDPSSGAETSETGWSLTSTPNAATGGGISSFFTRPDWQTGPGLDSGTMREVPDVSVVGDPNTGCYIVYNGSGATVYGGTSVSAPIWTGFATLINQARADAGLPPLGLLGPKIYPLIGTSDLRDITSGNNGLYNAGPGYDLVSGVGTPDMATLVTALAPQSGPPMVTSQPSSATVMPGHDATFTFRVTGSPTIAYQWQREPAGGTSFENLSADTTYAGTTSNTLTVHSVTTAMNGDLFQCVVTNSEGTLTAPSVALIVAEPLSVTTFAGLAGNAGSADGTGAAARFNGPSDLAVDASGNLYVTDTNNHTVRKITADGVVTTLAGAAGTSGAADGTGSAARFDSPTGITIDGAGNLYVADTDNDTIRKITADGVVTTVAGTAQSTGSADGGASAARFDHPSDVTVDASGNLYVADTDNDTIRKISPAGDVTTVAGLADTPGSTDGAGSAARFFSPEGIAVDASGNLYIADTSNHTVRKISPAGTVTTLAGLAGTSGGSDGRGTAARFQFPSDLAVDGSGNLFVADTDNHTIREITPAGLTATVAGLAGTSGNADGTGTSARFYYPTGVAVDTSGKVYVADTNNATIRTGVTVVAPEIVTQPQDQSVAAGGTASFSVTATGVPAPTYQWYKGGTLISGATGATYSLSNVQSANAGSYTVTVTNDAGSVTSQAASLTVTGGATPAETPGSSGGGGGGGALPAWFVLSLAILAAVRGTVRQRRAGRD